MKKVLLICFGLITILLYFSCKPKSELIKPCVIPYSEAKEPPLFIYNLPATTLCVEIKIKQTQSFKGPYSDFAQKFLGLNSGSVIKRNSIYYEITGVEFSQFETPDSSQWYAYMNAPSIIPNFSLSQENVLTCFNCLSNNYPITTYPSINNRKPDELEMFFNDLGIVKIENEEIQTIYRHIKRDSTIIKIPIQETVKGIKSDEEMARQASEFITKIKNQRYELVAGLYEVFPEGASLKASIEEMYNVENRYLRLFTGVSIDTTYVLKFYFTPQENSITPIIKTLCYFDNETGPTLISNKQQYTNNNINQHLRLEIEYANYHPLSSQRITNGGLVYRIPALCNMKLLQGEETLSDIKLNINQLGNVFQLPVDVLNKNVYKIEIDSKTGNLKSINTTETYNTQIKKKKQ